MSTRPPLSPQHIHNETSHQRTIHSTPFLTQLLSKLYLAAHTLQLNTETRYAYFTLFHRCLSHYIHFNFTTEENKMNGLDQSRNNNGTMNSNATKMQREELANLAAASIFLACKLCNQQRRIRDVINVKHILRFNQTASHDDHRQYLHKLKLQNEAISDSLNQEFQPPPLDEEYWRQKEEMVRVEQTLLRILAFDVNITYPHRILVVLWEELVTVATSSMETNTCVANGDDTKRNGEVDENGSIKPRENGTQSYLKIWKRILNAAWIRLNNSVFHVDAMMCKSSSLACASLSLGMEQVTSEKNFEVHNSGLQTQPSLSLKLHNPPKDLVESEWCEWFGVKQDELRKTKELLIEASNLVSSYMPKMT